MYTIQNFDIPLQTYFPIVNQEKYKLHFMTYNGVAHPFDLDRKELMTDWQNWRNEDNQRNRWGNAEYIFALLDFPDENDIWLFMGIFKILSKNKNQFYETTLVDKYEEMIGRLKILYKNKPKRPSYPYLKNVYNKLILYEILREPKQ